MIALLHELGLLFADLWATANRWARWTILFIVLWPVVLALVALAGIMSLTSLLALLPVAALLCLMMFRITQAGQIARHVGPVGVAVAAVFPGTRRAVRGLAVLIGLELAFGIYFSIVPISKAPALLPLLFLSWFTVLFLVLGGYRGWVRSAVVVLIVALTLVFFVAGYFRAAINDFSRTESNVEQCVERGGRFQECVERATSTAPERIRSEIVELHPVAWTGPFWMLGECFINPAGPASVYAMSDVTSPLRIVSGTPVAIPIDFSKRRFWLKGGPVELITTREPGCKRGEATPPPGSTS